MNNLTNVQKELLNLLGVALFEKENNIQLDVEGWKELFQEATSQAVYSIVASVAKVPEQMNETVRKRRDVLIAKNIVSNYEHQELHQLFTTAGIPYCILKGCVSAYYYPTPIFRAMGDVDFFVKQEDRERTTRLLEENGFKHPETYLIYDEPFYRGKSIWELHWGISGTPEGKVGKIIEGYFDDIVEKAVYVPQLDGGFYMTSPFHHCLIMLLHCTHHMLAGGIGLRHLCDWAVFANQVDVNQWNKQLESCGLWNFAKKFTLLTSTYLGMNEQPWTGYEDKQVLEAFMSDIFDSGNFGQKDNSRNIDGLLIRTEGEGYINNSSNTEQLIKSLCYITVNHWPVAKKIKILQPVGALFFGGRYIFRMLTGKRRKVDFGKNINRATQRKQLYMQMRLFEVEDEK